MFECSTQVLANLSLSKLLKVPFLLMSFEPLYHSQELLTLETLLWCAAQRGWSKGGLHLSHAILGMLSEFRFWFSWF